MEVARIFLALTWVAGVALVIIAIMAFGLKHRIATMIGSIVILTVTLVGLEILAIQQAPPITVRQQRFLPEDKIGRMAATLWIGRGRDIMLMHDGGIEARGFSKQIESVLESSGWKVIGNGERFPPTRTKSVMKVKGASLDDPGILSLQAAFAIAGFDVRYEPTAGRYQNIWLDF